MSRPTLALLALTVFIALFLYLKFQFFMLVVLQKSHVATCNSILYPQLDSYTATRTITGLNRTTQKQRRRLELCKRHSCGRDHTFLSHIPSQHTARTAWAASGQFCHTHQL